MAVARHEQFTRVASVYDDLMSVVPYAYWVDYVEQLWRHFGFNPHSVLDLACGTGNVLLEFRRRGYRVAGVDNSAAMLREARAKAGARVSLYCQDMRSLRLRRPFDACVCLFDSLNYLLEEEDLRAAFRSVYRHLRPGGVLVFDMNTIRALEAGMFNQEGHGFDSRLRFVWRSHYDPGTRLCRIEMEFVTRGSDDACVFHEMHLQRGYSRQEVFRSLEAAELEVMGNFESFTEREPSARSDRFHFVARRPPE